MSEHPGPVEHDPLCGSVDCGCDDAEECGPECRHHCVCDLIARVQADAYARGQRDALASEHQRSK